MKLFAAFALLWLLSPIPLASADESYSPRHHRAWRYNLPPERHVIEGVRPPGSGNFLINGRMFTARDPACWGWVAGERIRLVAGD